MLPSFLERTMNINKKCSTCENSGCWACDLNMTEADVVDCISFEPIKRCELESVDQNLQFGRMARPRYQAKLIERAKAMRVGKIITIGDALEVLDFKVA